MQLGNEHMTDLRTLIQSYASAQIGGLIGKIKASSKLGHRLTKGELRELFLSDLLRPFLTHQFGLGSGIIVNQNGKESRQTDIIVYDKSIIPPFIKESHIGVYPAESVIATIEVKSNLRKTDILETESALMHLYESVYNPKDSIYQDYQELRPLCILIGYYGQGMPDLKSQDEGKEWLDQNTKFLSMICLFGKFSWIKMKKNGWRKSQRTEHNEETKRLIAVFIDNLRTKAFSRTQFLNQFAHKDWIGAYIREK